MKHIVETRPDPDTRTFAKEITRRNFIKLMSFISGAVFTGCSDLNLLLDIFPDRFKDNKELTDRILHSFAVTVIPGADEEDKDLVRIFHDDYYPFSKYCNYFAGDLCKRSSNIFGEEYFCNLSLKQRTSVIEGVLSNQEEKNIARLYESAIFLTQVSYYAGIYDDAKGCQLIYFKGRNTGYTPEEMFYDDSKKYLAVEITADGNFN